MNVWKFCIILGVGIALILLFVGITLPETQQLLTAVVGAIGAANFALLAVIADKLSTGNDS